MKISDAQLSTRFWLSASAWLAMLVISELPDILWKTIAHRIPEWLVLAKLGFLILFFMGCRLWRALRPLRSYALVLMVFQAALILSGQLESAAGWRSFWDHTASSFTLTYLPVFIRDCGVMLVVLGVLWWLKGHRRAFYLVEGEPGAPIEPVRWLGIKPGESWRVFGWIFALAAAAVVMIPTVAGAGLTAGIWLRTMVFLPAALLFAAVNAFNEEIYFRLSLLATLPEAIGRRQALLINVVFFGLAHYLYGSPPGAIGFVMTAFLAWLLGKSILETNGLLWAWFIHFLPDVVIFLSYATAWVQRS